ncbi:hypothetical protein UZ36_07910 [Candidatus Nitromaritima sp. SCGC AAA799-C22]|nr:hypothetical protein UZ36_07910 [Candidatus Nitromaritima sp. SCGC AAA799-C22]
MYMRDYFAQGIIGNLLFLNSGHCDFLIKSNQKKKEQANTQKANQQRFFFQRFFKHVPLVLSCKNKSIYI